MLLFYLENYWCFVERLHIVREESHPRSQKQKKGNVAFVLFLLRRQLHQPDTSNILWNCFIHFPFSCFFAYMTCHMTVSLFVCVLKCCAYIVFLYVCFSETVVVILCYFFVCDSGALLILCVCVRWQPLDRTLGNAYTHNDQSSLTMIALPPDFFITIMKGNQFSNTYALSPNPLVRLKKYSKTQAITHDLPASTTSAKISPR